MKKPAKPPPLWPMTFVRAARWLGYLPEECGPSPRAISKLLSGKRVTFNRFHWLVRKRISVRWTDTDVDELAFWRFDTPVDVGRDGRISVSEVPVADIRAHFHAGADFAECARKFAISTLDVEAAIAFPW